MLNLKLFARFFLVKSYAKSTPDRHRKVSTANGDDCIY